MNDQELASTVLQAQQGSREALEKVAVWFFNQDAFFDCAYRILRNHEDARDVMAESAMKVYLKISTYNPRRASFKTWCYTVVTRTALDLLRKFQRRGRQNESEDGETGGETVEQLPSSPSQSPERILIRREAARILDEAEEDAGLSWRERAVWCLSRAGHDNSEIAEILRITNRPVERAKHRAKEKIKRYIDTNYPDFRI